MHLRTPAENARSRSIDAREGGASGAWGRELSGSGFLRALGEQHVGRRPDLLAPGTFGSPLRDRPREDRGRSPNSRLTGTPGSALGQALEAARESGWSTARSASRSRAASPLPGDGYAAQERKREASWSRGLGLRSQQLSPPVSLSLKEILDTPLGASSPRLSRTASPQRQPLPIAISPNWVGASPGPLGSRSCLSPTSPLFPGDYGRLGNLEQELNRAMLSWARPEQLSEERQSPATSHSYNHGHKPERPASRRVTTELKPEPQAPQAAPGPKPGTSRSPQPTPGHSPQTPNQAPNPAGGRPAAPAPKPCPSPRDACTSQPEPGRKLAAATKHTPQAAKPTAPSPAAAPRWWECCHAPQEERPEVLETDASRAEASKAKAAKAKASASLAAAAAKGRMTLAETADGMGGLSPETTADTVGKTESVETSESADEYYGSINAPLHERFTAVGAHAATGSVHMLITALDYDGAKFALTSSAEARHVEHLASAAGVQDVAGLYNEGCTKERVAGEIKSMAHRCTPGDTFVFYFIGHGTKVRVALGEDACGVSGGGRGESSSDEAFCFVDQLGRLDSATVMTGETFGQLITRSLPRGVRLVLLIDSVHRAPILDLRKECWNQTEAILLTGFLRKEEVSRNSPCGGVFTHALLAAVEEMTRAGKDLYSVGTLYNRLLEMDAKLFRGAQDLAIQWSSGTPAAQASWPLVPLHAHRPYRAPWSKQAMSV